MEILKKIGKICFILLVAIALVVDGLFIYYHFFVKENELTTGINYISDQNGIDIKNKEDMTEEELEKFQDRWFLEANYYSNDKQNGIQLQELKLNYFMDYNLTSNSYRSTGMQYLGNFKTYANEVGSEEEANQRVVENFVYYDSTNGVDFNGYNSLNHSVANKLNRDTETIIKIDAEAYSIKLDGMYVEKHGKTNFGKWFYNLIGKETIHYFDYGDLFECVMQSIKTNNKKYGDYYITLDLTNFFSIKKFDSQTGKFLNDDVTDIIKNYSVLKFHYDENGAARASQSIFKTINFDKNYGEYNTEYWQERFVYNLTEKDLLFRQSEQYEGHLATLGSATKNKFDQMKRAKVNISINLNSEYLKNKNINVVGLDYLAFENFEIDTLTITGSCDNFHILNQSLKNTNLKTLKHSKSIILDIHDGAIDTAFSEVVI